MPSSGSWGILKIERRAYGGGKGLNASGLWVAEKLVASFGFLVMMKLRRKVSTRNA
jgi:hypothetical protein